MSIHVTNDEVNHPSHYNSHPEKIEAIQITKHEGFLLGNCFKYLLRHGLKGDMDKAIQDVEKAIWYLKEYLTDLKAQREEALPNWRRKSAK